MGLASKRTKTKTKRTITCKKTCIVWIVRSLLGDTPPRDNSISTYSRTGIEFPQRERAYISYEWFFPLGPTMLESSSGNARQISRSDIYTQGSLAHGKGKKISVNYSHHHVVSLFGNANRCMYYSHSHSHSLGRKSLKRCQVVTCRG